MSDEQNKAATEWAEGDGFSIVAHRFTESRGLLALDEDPRNILVDAHNALVPPLAARIASLEARIASLEAERDRATERADGLNALLHAQARRKHEAQAERDGLAATIEQIRKLAAETDTETHEATQAWLVGNIGAALAKSPADAMAGVKAEAAATALEVEGHLLRDFHGMYEADEILSNRAAEYRAAAIRSEVK